MKNYLLKTFLICVTALFAFACRNDGTLVISKYTVIVTSDGNGSALADQTDAEAGQIINLTATANSGYAFKQWVVESGSVILSNAATATAMFVMPAEDVSIKAEFESFYVGVTINGVTWSEFNVNDFGEFTTNITDCGMFYQWGRKTAWLSAGDPVSSPEGSTWNSNSVGEADDTWLTVNDPCPNGWHVPTKDEGQSLFESNVTSTWVANLDNSGIAGRRFTDQTTNASIFFPAAGSRNGSDGLVASQGTSARYWTATAVTSTTAASLTLSAYAAQQATGTRSFGFSVRCVRK